MKQAAFFAIAFTLAGGAVACESGHWVSKVAGDGEFVVLENNSVWQINAVDQIDTSLWLPTTSIVACDDKLVNTDDGEVAEAFRIR
ncbi:hypothetical protein [Paraburkholderia saeva]|jgi:hypothetical protein|uniref:Uncharacterized protein n=1 Tax=Paraburkholderia saeva TaxID=2777537 RepID=A0A9N8RX74_9BURK|nr:hypothetical protein [Paraburkholderia saeva]CAG4890753.1 hypothetical protein R52603_01003 [Paraburkholderia saeva]CAG4901340.1 hypothetical protein LMG31841_02981 [Paraburkholderia saeva]